jgi:hypothetical protein
VMKIVKLSTSPWALTQEEFNYYTPNGDGIVAEYKFEVNNDCDECNFWIVRGDISRIYEFVNCNKENLIFLQDEVYDENVYPSNFLNQFAAVIGARPEFHAKYIPHHEMMPWLFDKKSYSDLLQPIPLDLKTKTICLMTSDATWLEGHRKRLAFSNKLIGHFKEKLDVYGRGFSAFNCKYEILKNYKYCIALENTVYPKYFTEKLNECYLSESFPIYYGCPDIESYYGSDSLVKIDVNDYKTSINTIARLIEDDLFERRVSILREMKKRYLEKWHLPIALVRILNSKFSTESSKKKLLVLNRAFFDSNGSGIKLLGRGVKTILANGVGKALSLARFNKW